MTTKSVITSASDATVSIFDTVAHTATQASKLINAIGTSVNMFDRFVTDAEERQRARSIVDMEVFYEHLHEDTAIARAQHQNEIKNILKQDPEIAELYSENYSKLKATMDRIRSKE